MRSVADVYEQALHNVTVQTPLELPLLSAAECVLAQDVTADINYPSTDVALWDGYAIRSQDTHKASAVHSVRLPILKSVRASSGRAPSWSSNTAVYVSAGSALPIGADAVVPAKDAKREQSELILDRRWAPAEGVLGEGQDIARGSVICQAGTLLDSGQVAVLAAVGKSRVMVHPRPRVVILPVGDELLELGTRPREGKVFDVNGPSLSIAAEEAGAETYRCAPVPDNRLALRSVLEDQLMRADLVITVGGISREGTNTVRETLGRMGNVRFEDVRATPGGIVGIGTISLHEGEGQQVPVFCLPGSPIDAQVCFEVYVRPALKKMQGWKRLNRTTVQTRAATPFRSAAGLREFVYVRLSGSSKSGYQAHPLTGERTQAISALAEANALAVLPEEKTNVEAGDPLTCLLLR